MRERRFVRTVTTNSHCSENLWLRAFRSSSWTAVRVVSRQNERRAAYQHPHYDRTVIAPNSVPPQERPSPYLYLSLSRARSPRHPACMPTLWKQTTGLVSNPQPESQLADACDISQINSRLDNAPRKNTDRNAIGLNSKISSNYSQPIYLVIHTFIFSSWTFFASLLPLSFSSPLLLSGGTRRAHQLRRAMLGGGHPRR